MKKTCHFATAGPSNANHVNLLKTSLDIDSSGGSGFNTCDSNDPCVASAAAETR